MELGIIIGFFPILDISQLFNINKRNIKLHHQHFHAKVAHINTQELVEAMPCSITTKHFT